MPLVRKYDLVFFTATILNWKHLLANDSYKDIIVGSLRWFTEHERLRVVAFVIMNNHMHIIWQIIPPHNKEDVQRDFLKFTAQTILKDLRYYPEVLQEYYVGAKDRKYQVWERKPLSIGIWSEDVLQQKLDYIHQNPVKAGLCTRPEDYRYSTAKLYLGENSEWTFVEPIFMR